MASLLIRPCVFLLSIIRAMAKYAERRPNERKQQKNNDTEYSMVCAVIDKRHCCSVYTFCLGLFARMPCENCDSLLSETVILSLLIF